MALAEIEGIIKESDATNKMYTTAATATTTTTTTTNNNDNDNDNDNDTNINDMITDTNVITASMKHIISILTLLRRRSC